MDMKSEPLPLREELLSPVISVCCDHPTVAHGGGGQRSADMPVAYENLGLRNFSAKLDSCGKAEIGPSADLGT
jgi:hypothetical protein